MKVIAVNGSPRKNGNTFKLLEIVTHELQKEGIETEIFQLGGNLVHGCTGCRMCSQNQNKRCVIEDDPINECIEKMIGAEGMIIGSPVYFANVTTEVKALIDRAGYVGLANGGLFTRKLGSAVIAVRRAGSLPTFDTINHFFQISQMIIPGSRYWNLAIGRDPGEVLEDSEGISTMQILAQNYAWLLRKIHGN